MGVVGSLPSPPTKLEDETEISPAESILSNDKCSYCDMMNDEIDSNTNSPVDEDNTSQCKKGCRVVSPVTVTYGPINIKVRQSVAPTLATGRRSKFIKLEGDAALKREIRRRRNREAAKKLKEKRLNIEQQLEKEIHDLESRHTDLLLIIQNLQSYKQELEVQSENISCLQNKLSQTTSSTLKKLKRTRRRIPQSVPIHLNNTHVNQPPRSSSPQWQLLFSI